MGKKPNLAAALHQAAGHPDPVPPPGPAGEIIAPAGRRSSVPPPSRTGLKTVAGHFDPAVSRQLRAIALERDTSLQELLREAINDPFVKHGRPPLA